MRTSLYSILCIVVRMGAILLIVQTVVGLPLAWPGVRGGQFGAGAESMLIGFGGALVALGITLWIYPGMLARLAAGQASRQVFESPISSMELQYIAFAVLGAAFAMNGLIDLVGVGMRAALTFNLRAPALANLRREDWARIATLGLRLVLGVILMFGSSGLAGLLYRLRETGLRPASPAERQEGEP